MGTEILQKKSFLIVKHSLGSSYPGPAESLEKFLRNRFLNLVVISHPLNKKSHQLSRMEVYQSGVLVSSKSKTRYLPHPIGRIFDPLVFRSLPVNDFEIAIGFNALSLFQCVVIKRLKNINTIAYWGVDYVPQNARNWLMWQIENLLKILCSGSVNYQIELTQRVSTKRNFKNKSLAVLVNPIGLDQSDYILESMCVKKNPIGFVFLGALNSRTGVDFAIDVVSLLKKVFPLVKLDIVGEGELIESLHQKVAGLGLKENVNIYGFLREGQQLKNILENASYGFAPFPRIPNSFTYYADPQKIKRYLGAGNIVLTTFETEIGEKLARDGFGVVFDSSASAEEWAIKIEEIVNNQSKRDSILSASLDFSKTLDNEVLFDTTINTLLG